MTLFSDYCAFLFSLSVFLLDSNWIFMLKRLVSINWQSVLCPRLYFPRKTHYVVCLVLGEHVILVVKLALHWQSFAPAVWVAICGSPGWTCSVLHIVPCKMCCVTFLDGARGADSTKRTKVLLIKKIKFVNKFYIQWPNEPTGREKLSGMLK